MNTTDARSIAALYQSLGYEGIGMAKFASTGAVTEELIGDIARELSQRWEAFRATGQGAESLPDDLMELSELEDHVNTLMVTVWSVGNNVPRTIAAYALNYADALSEYIVMIEEAPQSLCGDCACDEDELCELCVMTAQVAAYGRDEVPVVVGGKIFGGERTLSLTLSSESTVLPTVYWLGSTTMTVQEYRNL